MLNLLRFLQKNLIWAVPLFMTAGFITGIAVENLSILKSLILPFTFLMVYPMMVTMQFRKIFEKGGFKVQVVTQLINFGIIPFIALFIGKLYFSANPYFALGILLVSLLPTSGMTISWTGMSGGNMEAAVKMTVFGLLFGSLLTPFYLKGLMGATISIPLIKIIAQIIVIVLLPMLLGFITQNILIKRFGIEKWQKEIKKNFPPVSTLGVLSIVFIAIALKARSIVANPGTFFSLLPPLVLLYALNLLISTFTAKKFFRRKDGIALVYGTVLRNLSIALAIAMTSFGSEGSSIALVIALGYIIQIQISAWYVKLTPLIFGSPLQTSGKQIV